MKETRLYKTFVVLSISVFIFLIVFVSKTFIEWGIEKYQDSKHPVKPGMTMFNVMREEDPFAEKDTTWIRVIQIKDGYVQYEYLNKEYKDTTSSKINYIRYFTPVNLIK